MSVKPRTLLFSGMAVAGITLMAGCGTNQAASWNYHLKLSWHGVRYQVTRGDITNPGRHLGEIRYYGHGETYNLYSVPGTTPHQAICIKTSTGYLLALGTNATTKT